MKINEEILELYLNFVWIRQNAWLKKQKDFQYIDPILGNSKFTNVYRILDRVSQYELLNVIYSKDSEPYEVLFRIFVFNHFKTQAFWKYLTSNYVLSSKVYKTKFFVDCLREYKGTQKLFTPAYMVPGKPGEEKIVTISRKISYFLGLNFSDNDFTDGQKLFTKLKTIPGMGNFLSSQVVFDCFWHKNFKHTSRLYQLGIGAERGASKLGFSSNSGSKEILEFLKYKIHTDTTFNPITYNNLMYFPDYADLQNTLCEFDKYMRLVRPDIGKPMRIKNKYKPGKQFKTFFPGHFFGEENLDLVEII